MKRAPLACCSLVAAGLVAAQSAAAQSAVSYERSTAGTRRLESESGLAITVLVEAANLGSAEVELAEITFPVGSGEGDSGHRHGAIEILYVLSGVLDHLVEGESHVLAAGMVGIVRPGDAVVHRIVGDEPVRALVVWAPGGEADRIARFFRERPLDG